MNSREKDEERKFELIWKKNWMLLAEFNDWMLGRGLSKRTSHMHLSNVTMYMQEYLMYDGPLPPANGTIGIGMYLGSWFIRKAPYASPGTVRSNATSIVKFYSFLLEKGLITPGALEQMRESIRLDMRKWQERARQAKIPPQI